MNRVEHFKGNGAVKAVVDLISLPLVFDVGGLGGVGVDDFHSHTPIHCPSSLFLGFGWWELQQCV